MPRLVASGQLLGAVPWLLATAIPGALAAVIVLEAATWAERQDRAYYDALLDIVERISEYPDALLQPPVSR